ncbi:MAG: DUF4296 domain-containing protein [Saprospiraceae bacterium]|nr:DUF4296 domain-containing protein [Saprospiraceae bacterium]
MKYFIFSVLCFLGISCGKDGSKAPVIPESKLVSLLVDVHIAEVAIQDAPAAAKDSVAALWYGYVFKQHNVQKEDFEQSIKALRSDPKRIGKVYEKVQEELDKRK